VHIHFRHLRTLTSISIIEVTINCQIQFKAKTTGGSISEVYDFRQFFGVIKPSNEIAFAAGAHPFGAPPGF
jgi:hypothetical protein